MICVAIVLNDAGGLNIFLVFCLCLCVGVSFSVCVCVYVVGCEVLGGLGVRVIQHKHLVILCP